MAISTLAGGDKWTEIASSSPTSGSTVSFTSIPEYKDLAVLAYNINNGGTATALTIRFNNDSGNNYSRNILWWRNITGGGMEVTGSPITTSIYATRETTQPTGFQLLIENANSPLKTIRGIPYDLNGFETNGSWHSSDAINRIDVISSATYSAGTIKLYGRN